MFQELERLKGHNSEDALKRRQDLKEQVTIELVRHSVAEEVIVYPRVASKISQDQVDHAREEHKEAEETMARLEKLDPTDASFDAEMDELMKEIRHHIEDEEGEMFAAMREGLSDDELKAMGTAVSAFKKVAPTHPHPNVPNSALGRLAAGPAASLFDRFRDLATNRGTDD